MLIKIDIAPKLTRVNRINEIFRWKVGCVSHMIDKHIVWRKEWIRPYESSWSILEKFSCTNVVDKNDILRVYGSPRVKSIKGNVIGDMHRELIYLTGFDNERLSSALNFNIEQHVNELLNITISLLPDSFNWFHNNFQWCDDCLRYGYHSYFHQFVLLHHCPFHLKPLSHHCPSCNKTFPYKLNDKINFFTCECGHQFADFNDHWNKWSMNSINIMCPLLKNWIELNTQSQKAKLVFLPEYAVNNKRALELLITSLLGKNQTKTIENEVEIKEFNPHYNKWKVFDVPEMRYPADDYTIRSLYSYNLKFKGFYRYFYENSRQIFKAIDHWIIREHYEHRHCIRRFSEVRKESNNTFPPICPFAYAYMLWKQSLLGFDKYYRGQEIGAYKRSPKTFSLITRFFLEEDNYIFDELIEKSDCIRADRPWEILWIMNNITVIFSVSLFNAWRSISVKGAAQTTSPDLSSLNALVKQYTPFFVIKISPDSPISIYKYKTNLAINDLRVDPENCLKRIDNKLEKLHDPLAYTMRYFDSNEGYPEYYQEELRYVESYVKRLNAPVKYKGL